MEKISSVNTFVIHLALLCQYCAASSNTLRSSFARCPLSGYICRNQQTTDALMLKICVVREISAFVIPDLADISKSEKLFTSLLSLLTLAGAVRFAMCGAIISGKRKR